jgi:translation elongation factor EF-Ts
VLLSKLKLKGSLQMAEKIALGKVNKFSKDNTLLAQPFVKTMQKIGS